MTSGAETHSRIGLFQREYGQLERAGGGEKSRVAGTTTIIARSVADADKRGGAAVTVRQ